MDGAKLLQWDNDFLINTLGMTDVTMRGYLRSCLKEAQANPVALPDQALSGRTAASDANTNAPSPPVAAGALPLPADVLDALSGLFPDIDAEAITTAWKRASGGTLPSRKEATLELLLADDSADEPAPKTPVAAAAASNAAEAVSYYSSALSSGQSSSDIYLDMDDLNGEGSDDGGYQALSPAASDEEDGGVSGGRSGVGMIQEIMDILDSGIHDSMMSGRGSVVVDDDVTARKQYSEWGAGTGATDTELFDDNFLTALGMAGSTGPRMQHEAGSASGTNAVTVIARATAAAEIAAKPLPPPPPPSEGTVEEEVFSEFADSVLNDQQHYNLLKAKVSPKDLSRSDYQAQRRTSIAKMSKLFPDMPTEVIEAAFDDKGGSVDVAIDSLLEQTVRSTDDAARKDFTTWGAAGDGHGVVFDDTFLDALGMAPAGNIGQEGTTVKKVEPMSDNVTTGETNEHIASSETDGRGKGSQGISRTRQRSTRVGATDVSAMRKARLASAEKRSSAASVAHANLGSKCEDDVPRRVRTASVAGARPLSTVLLASANAAASAAGEAKNWQSRQAASVIETMDPNEVKRQEAIDELTRTEEVYLADVHALRVLLVSPMEKQTERDGVSSDPELTIKQVRFNSKAVTELETIGRRFVEELKALRGPTGSVQGIREVVVSWAVELKRMFVAYCVTCFHLQKCFDRAAAGQSPRFQELLGLAAKDTKMRRNLPVSAFVLSPVQRLARYPLLLQAILKRTAKGTAEYLQLDMAYKTAQSAADASNQRLRALEDHDVVRKIERELDVSRLAEPVELSKKHGIKARTLVKRGTLELVKLSERGRVSSSKKLEFLLFSDLLMYAKYSKKRGSAGWLQVHQQVHRSAVEARLFDSTKYTKYQSVKGRQQQKQQDADATLLTLTVYAQGKPEPLTLRAPTPSDVKRWLTAFHPSAKNASDCDSSPDDGYKFRVLENYEAVGQDELTLRVGDILMISADDIESASSGEWVEASRILEVRASSRPSKGWVRNNEFISKVNVPLATFDT